MPMMETTVAFTTTEHTGGHLFDPPIGPMGYGSIRAGSRRPYKTRAGYLAFLPYSNQHWRKFLTAVGRPELMQDPRFESFDYEVAFGEVAAQMATKTNAEWLALFQGVDIPIGIVNDLEDLASDPHLESVGFWQVMEHPTEGSGVPPAFRSSFRLPRQHPRTGTCVWPARGRAAWRAWVQRRRDRPAVGCRGGLLMVVF